MKNKIFLILIILLLFSLKSSYSQHGNWKISYGYTELIYNGISKSDSNYVMALGNYGFNGMFIDLSRNGGKNWAPRFNDTTYKEFGPRAISYPSRDFAIVAVDSFTFYRTQDTGNTWQHSKIELPLKTAQSFYIANMHDRNNGILASLYYIVISHDGFVTWDTVLSPGGKFMMIYAATMAGPNSVCVVSRQYGDTTYNTRFFRSDDGCKTWNEFPHVDYIAPVKLLFLDSLLGYEIGDEATGHGQSRYHYVFKTTNGGRSWDKILDTLDYPDFGLEDFDFYDKDNGIIACKYGKIYWTHDGGKTWIFDSCDLLMHRLPFTDYTCYIRKERALVCDFFGYLFMADGFNAVIVDDVSLDKPNIKAYPNPVSELLTIDLPDMLIYYEDLRFYDSYGREIKDIRYYKQPSSGSEVTIDVSAFPVGIYYAIFKTAHKTQQLPFVVVR